MSYGDYRSGVLTQVFFEPQHRLGIEVVGWLVEQEHIGLLKQQAAQGPAPFFAPGQHVDDSLGWWAAQGVHRPFELLVEFPAVEMVNFLLDLALPGNQLVEVSIGVTKRFVDLLKLFQ